MAKERTVKQKIGYWDKGYTFPDGAYWRCSHCHELIKVKFPMNYCNNCGARMVKKIDEGEKKDEL